MPASQTTLLIKYVIDESSLEPAMRRLHGTLSESHSLHASLGDERWTQCVVAAFWLAG